MRNSPRKHKKIRSNPTEIVSARLPKPELSTLRKLYPGSSNQDIVVRLIEEKLARRDFDTWLKKVQEAVRSDGLNLEQV